MIARLVLLALLVHGVPTPRGSKAVADAPDRVASGKSYRDTADFVRRWLAKQGVAYHQLGPYRARGVDVTRFVSDSPTTEWLAIHVYKQAGTTWLVVVPRPG